MLISLVMLTPIIGLFLMTLENALKFIFKAFGLSYDDIIDSLKKFFGLTY